MEAQAGCAEPLPDECRQSGAGERIRVLNLLTNFHIGGTERQVANIALRLDPSRFDLHLACFRTSGELLDELRDLAVPRPEFRIGSLYSFRTLVEAVKMIRYLRRNRIRIVHSYGTYPNIFAVPIARLAGVPVIITSIRDRGDILASWQRWLQKAVCRLADCVLVNAATIRETLIAQGYRADNIEVIPNGVVPQKTAPKAGVNIREELGLAPDTAVVLVFSRLNRMKGVEYLLEAAVKVCARVPRARFVIAGDGPARAELESYAKKLGIASSVFFTGFRTDLPHVLKEADLSVLPSLSEGLSNSILEAMLAGVPVVATNVGGNPEIIEDEVSGLLVPPRDSAALADAITRAFEEPGLRARLSAAGKRRIPMVFSMERSLESIEQLYERLLRKGVAA